MAKKLPEQGKEIKKEKAGTPLEKPLPKIPKDPLREKLKTRLPKGTPEALIEEIFLDELNRNEH